MTEDMGIRVQRTEDHAHEFDASIIETGPRGELIVKRLCGPVGERETLTVAIFAPLTWRFAEILDD